MNATKSKTRQYVAVIESTMCAAGEVVASCRANRRESAERKIGGDCRDVMTATEAKRLGCRDPKMLTR